MENTEIINDTVEEIEGNPVVGLIVVGTFTALAAVGAYHVGISVGHAARNFVTGWKMKKAELTVVPAELVQD